MAWTFYHNFVLETLGNTAANRVDFTTSGDTLKVALATNSYSPSQANDNYFNDVTNEVTGTSYVAGGATLASKTWALATGVCTFDAADVTWSQSGSGFSTARYAILYKDSAGASSTDLLIAYANLGADKGNVTGDLVLQFDAAGIFTTAVA